MELRTKIKNNRLIFKTVYLVVRFEVFTAVTMKNSIFWDVAGGCNLLTLYFSTLKVEAIRSSETSVHTRCTRRHIPEDGILYILS
jgi:hypothetical protein